MPIKDLFKVSRKTFFNPAGWVGYGWVKDQTILFWDLVRDQFKPAKPERTETFAEAVTRLKLSPKS